MYITVTTSKPKSDQLRKIEAFLSKLLPRLEQQPGVVAIYHYVRPEQGDDSTIIIWKNQESVKTYQEGSLSREARAFEKEQHLASTREGYPLTFPTSRNG